MAASSGRKKADINRCLLCAVIYLNKKEGEDPLHIFIQYTAAKWLTVGKSNQNILCADIWKFISFTCAGVTCLVNSEIVKAILNW